MTRWRALIRISAIGAAVAAGLGGATIALPAAAQTGGPGTTTSTAASPGGVTPQVGSCTVTLTTSGNGTGEFRGAITFANGGNCLDGAGNEVVTIQPGLGPISLNAGQALYNRSDPLIINGNGATIDAAGANRILVLSTNKTVTINSVTFNNGTPGNNRGGAIRADHDLVLNNCKFNQNSANNGGGAVSVDNGNVTVSGSTFTGNQTSGDMGGAIRSHRSFGNSNPQLITIANSQFTGNQAGEDGGGVWGDINISVTVTNSTFTNNSAGGTGGGGGISALGPVTVTGSTLTGNDATASPSGDGGGAIAADDAVTVASSSITNNTSHTEGGGIEATGTLKLTDTTVAGNQATVDAGGADTELGATVVRSTISGNIAGQDGGGIETCGDQSGNTSTVTSFTNSTVTNNTAQGEGGGINIPSDCGATLALTYSTVVSNTAHGVAETPEALAVGAKDEGAPSVHAQAVIRAGTGTANVSVDTQTLTSFGTVIALPLGGGPNCLTGTTTSNGWNFADDTSCAFTNAAQGDTQNPNDPKLGALAANGGATQTRLPQTGSPLIDAIPVASCQASTAAGITTDQRGVTRPQGAGCEIGAVEVQVTPNSVVSPAAAVPLVPRFTG